MNKLFCAGKSEHKQQWPRLEPETACLPKTALSPPDALSNVQSGEQELRNCMRSRRPLTSRSHAISFMVPVSAAPRSVHSKLCSSQREAYV